MLRLFSKKFTNKSLLDELLKKNVDEKKLNEILNSRQVSINYFDKDGNNFLSICLKNSQFKSALWLIDNNINLNMPDQDLKYPIDIAIEKNNLTIVKAILDKGNTDLNRKDKYGRTMLQNSVLFGYYTISKILIQYGTDVNSVDLNKRNVIFDAISFGDEKCIETLIAIKELELNNIDINQETIMHHPLIKKNSPLAKVLIESGAQTTIKDKNGKTFLCNTALKGIEYYDLVDTALKHGADINSTVGNNNTILIELISVIVKLEDGDYKTSLLSVCTNLIVAKIDKNAINDSGETALMIAVKASNIELVKFLLSYGVSTDIQNHNGETALFEAVYKGIENINIILLLLKYKANTLITNNRNETIYEALNNIILHINEKCYLEDKSIVKKLDHEGQYMSILIDLLKWDKRSLNFLDSNGDPLFFKPLCYDVPSLFKLYIKQGLDVHNKNSLNQNIFFAYVYHVFENDLEHINFQSNLSMLLSAKVDHNETDESGWSVVDKIIGTKCNINTFNTLLRIVRFDYGSVDNLGRSMLHTTVWFDNHHALKSIHRKDDRVLNISDTYGILPITYAALLGNQKLVLLFISLNTNVKSTIDIPKAAIEKFSPMLKNLDKLKDNIDDEDTIRKINIVIDQVQRDFKII